jgi:hypothetical protein
MSVNRSHHVAIPNTAGAPSVLSSAHRKERRMRTTPILGFMILAALSHAAWDHAHADSANTGFTALVTAPAALPMQFAPVGELAPGAGPVVSPDGMVYIGNLYGQVLAFHADGTPAWSRQLPQGQWVPSSPVIGADGTVYVVAEAQALVAGTTSDYRYESTLHIFSSTGGWLYQAPFPQRWGGYPFSSRGDAGAPPNVWHSNGLEVIIVPVVYDIPGAYTSLRLLAFSTRGQVLSDTLVWEPSPGTVTGGADFGFCDFFFCFSGPIPNGCTDLSVCLPEDTGSPPPGVAILQNPQGETPMVIVSAGIGLHDIVGYTFDLTRGFTESFRVHDAEHRYTSAPVGLPSGNTVLATAIHRAGDSRLDVDVGRLTLVGPNGGPVAGTSGDLGTGDLGIITAAPTRLADGRLVAIERFGRMTAFFVGGNTMSAPISLVGQSIASAAASCNYLYVASVGAFTTFDANTLASVATVPWPRGGRSSPAIGPFGHVYAVAATTMFVFPPAPSNILGGTTCDAGGGREVL